MADTTEPKKTDLKLDVKSLKTILAKITAPIQEHHALIMFLLLMAVLIYSVYSVSSIIQINDDPNYRAEAEAKSVTTSFDQTTIKKVDELRESNENEPIDLPGGRRNPFVN